MELTAQQVNDFIAKAVMDSQIGEIVKRSVARVTTDLQKSYQNPFDEAIKLQVSILIEKEVMTIYQPKLEAGVKAAMANYVTEDIVEKIVKSAIEKLNRNY